MATSTTQNRFVARPLMALLVAGAVLAGGCSSDDDEGAPDTSQPSSSSAASTGETQPATTPKTPGTPATTAPAGSSTPPETSGPTVSAPTVETAEPPETTVESRPDGPAATAVGLLTAGGGINLVAARVPDLGGGWVEEEYAVEGEAVRYRADGELARSGTFDLVEGGSAPYRTRIVVRRPKNAADFNGTVVVEWLNVSSGFDASPEYSYTGDELVRGGYAWVGVSAQHIGIEGGPVLVSTPVSEDAGAGRGLRALDPVRYGDLHHPGDAYSYDIYTQVGRLLRAPGGLDPLGGLRPERLLAAGESQSAFALTTYVDGVHPLTRVYDGFLIHSRAAGGAPLGEPGTGIGISGTLGQQTTRIRTDLDEPVIVLETESDVVGLLGYYAARQPDTDRLRVWEVAGTAHADEYLLGIAAPLMGCPGRVNAGPGHFVAKAALRHLDAWVRTGEAPPSAEPLAVDESGGEPAYIRDENGNVVGGIRTPLVDVPVDVLSGEAAEGSSVVCLLSGSTTPIPPERLAALYPSRDDYLAAYQAAADAAIESGFVLPEDHEALLAAADPSRITG